MSRSERVRRGDSLLLRLFGMFLLAILLAHLLAFIWFLQFAPPPGPPGPPSPPPGLQGQHGPPPPPPGRLAGPLIPLGFQLLALIIAAWFGARLLLRPLLHLTRAADNLSHDLDSPPLDEQGPAEVRQAARSFNRMQARIRAQVDQRGRILTALSHDLRTPLARMKLRLEQLDDSGLRSRLAGDLNEMTGMLEATLSYLSAQFSNEPQQWLDLTALLESLAENAREQGQQVELAGHCSPLPTRPLALRACLNNLLGNALRYAGSARLELQEESERVLIRVVDHGPGIPLEQREAVFEPFFRLESSRNRNSGGIGLGLSIAREASQRLHGRLHLDATPGGGLTAVLELPRRPV